MARRLLPAILVAVVLLLAPGHAGAAVRLEPCGQTPGLQCREVPVPLDRTGQTPGTISLHVEELPATGAQRGVLFLIAGGPGQGSAKAFDLGTLLNASFVRSLFPGYTLVAFDDRGTGSSGALRCPAFQAATAAPAETATALAAACANVLGPQRRFYSTADHAEDVEAVRQMLGADKIALWGTSYGTKLVLAYALAHPDHVERLLLDSVLPTDLPDPYMTNVLRAMPAALAAFCARGACRAATPDFAADVAALANGIEAKPLEAKVLQVNGKLKTERMNGEDFLSTVIQADLSPGLAVELPAAVRAARRGDPRPLVRLFEITNRTSVEPVEELSAGLYAATTCDDGLFPWAPQTPVAARPALLQAVIAGLPAGSFGPFGSWAARLGTAQLCLAWPEPAGSAPLAPGPLPDVPVLAVAGGFDMRTPVASAATVTSLFPQGHVLVVPGVGHSVLTSDYSLCSQQVVRNWLVGGSVPASCPVLPPLLRPLAAFPEPAPLKPASARGTVVFVKKTLAEATAAWLQVALARQQVPLAGLSGGRLVASKRDNAFTLLRYSLVPGVELSGTLRVPLDKLPLTIQGTVKVSGRAAAGGTLEISGGSISGTLDGRRVGG